MLWRFRFADRTVRQVFVQTRTQRRQQGRTVVPEPEGIPHRFFCRPAQRCSRHPVQLHAETRRPRLHHPGRGDRHAGGRLGFCQT